MEVQISENSNLQAKTKLCDLPSKYNFGRTCFYITNYLQSELRVHIANTEIILMDTPNNSHFQGSIVNLKTR